MHFLFAGGSRRICFLALPASRDHPHSSNFKANNIGPSLSHLSSLWLSLVFLCAFWGQEWLHSAHFDILRQWSPMFLAPGTSFVEDNFPIDQGGVEFQGDSRTWHLLCTLFLLLLHQLHLRTPGIRSQRLGTPELRHLPSLKSAD